MLVEDALPELDLDLIAVLTAPDVDALVQRLEVARVIVGAL